MKLSIYITRQKEKGVPKDWALGNAKGVVKKAGERWTKVKQKLFDDTWGAGTKIVKPVKQLTERGQGGTIEQRIKFFKTLVAPCRFPTSAWNQYGLHVISEGSEKRPSNIKTALDLLVKHGLAQTHRLPMSSEFADRNSQRAVTMYSDKYGNTANTVSQKSTNGKSDFYILNINPKLTQEDRNRLNSTEKAIDDKLKATREKIEQGKLRQPKHKNEAHEMSLSEFVKKMKGINSVRGTKPTTESLRDQWIEGVERALKAGLKVKPDVQREYVSLTKSVGGVYHLPVSKKDYRTVNLDARKLRSINRNLLQGKEVTIRSDDGIRFILSTTDTTGIKCDADLRAATGVKFYIRRK